MTICSKALMDGIAAHVEHIDCDKVTSKEPMEIYRLPATVNAAKVQLHIGNSVPVTAFIERPFSRMVIRTRIYQRKLLRWTS